MSIPDRIILTLYTVLMAVVAVFLVLFSLGVISTVSISTFAATVPGRWEYAIGGVVLLLVSLRLLIAGLGGTGGSNLSIGTEKEGKIHIGKGAVEDYIAEFSNDVFGVHNAKAVVKLADNLLSVRINASVEPGINVPDTTDEIKQVIKKNVLATIGIEVKDVEVYFKHIKPRG